MANVQLEIQLWSKEKSTGLETVILKGERKERRPKELQCLEVRDREGDPGAGRSES